MTPAKKCQKCHAEFHQNYTRGRPRLYCSDKCRQAVQGAKLRKEQEHEACTICGGAFVAARSDQKYCSATCRGKAATQRSLAKRHDEFSGVRICVDCLCEFPVDQPRSMKKFCDGCLRRRRRDTDAKKSQKRRGCGEPVALSTVIAARGERCHICQRKVNITLSGRHPMGPTIDHILPVSMGGTNDLANLNLAHRRCNIRRGNRGPAQMILEDVNAWPAA